MKTDRFINRELSWLEFNQRVLDQARDPRVPLLERLKFLAITASNLDEFFMVRVGGLHILRRQGVRKTDPAGLTPAEQLDRIRARTRRMVRDQYACYSRQIEKALAHAGVRRMRPEEMSEPQHAYAESVFAREIYPVLSPIAVSSSGPLPLLLNRALHMAVRLKPARGRAAPRFAVIPIARNLGRFHTLPGARGYGFVLIEDLVAAFAHRFFPGESVCECSAFRLTRNADLSVREEVGDDLLVEMSAVLDARKRSECVRLEADKRMSPVLLDFLTRVLGADGECVYGVPGPLDLSAFMSLAQIEGYEPLKYEPWPPRALPALEPGTSVLARVAQRDILLYHPYDSFDPVVRLVEEAADDPDVVAIKQILYRTSRNSPIVAALARAAEAGKHVTALVELKARFDEARNIEWARALEDAGVQVIYGVKGLKTHGKLCLVLRREPQGLQRYMHFGTGNYNEVTARLYGDVTYMTCDPILGADATAFFNAITGYSQPMDYQRLAAAPLGLRDALLRLIDGEIERRRANQEARIMAKVNSLADPELIRALYRASRAGVRVDLNVRGVCCLRPGVPGLSENISVVSIVDRFLEHCRVFYFHRGGDARVFISSADWMPRNLDRRVELLVPVEDPDCRRRLVHILTTHLSDNVNAWRLKPDGRYERLAPPPGGETIRSQEALYEESCDAARGRARPARTVFEPHRPSGSRR